MTSFVADYGLAFVAEFPMVKAASRDFAATGDWTPATGDTKIIKAGANAANTTNNPAAIGGTGSIGWTLTLTATEMSADRLLVQIVDSATKAVEDQTITIRTKPPNCMKQGTATGGSTTTVVDSGLSAGTDQYAGCVVEKYESDGTARESRICTTNTSTTITVATAFGTTAASGTRYRIYPFGALPATVTGGVVSANVTQFGGTNGTFSGGRPEVNTTHAAGTAWGSGAITSATFASSAINATAIAANAIGATKIADGALTAAKFAVGAFDAVWSVTARLLTAGTNIALAKGTGVTGFTDLSAADVRTAVGLASANLDTQIGTLATSSALATVGSNVDAVLADTGTDGVVVAAGSKSGYALSATGVAALTGSVPARLKKNTAFTSFPIKLELTDGSPGTGLTVTVQRSIDGGAFAALAVTTVTEISAGWYKFDFAASDLNGDVIAVKATATGAKQLDFVIVTQVAA